MTDDNADFQSCLARVLLLEGGYSDHAADKGGKTMFGITEQVARKNGYEGDMRDLSIQFAERVYRTRYWAPLRCDDLPAAVRYPAFDAAVNSGVGASARWLQRAVGTKQDGIVGPITVQAVRQADPHQTARKIISYRLRMMTTLSTWNDFGRGWAARIANVLED
jgi:lysozyme family protein